MINDHTKLTESSNSSTDTHSDHDSDVLIFNITLTNIEWNSIYPIDKLYRNNDKNDQADFIVTTKF